MPLLGVVELSLLLRCEKARLGSFDLRLFAFDTTIGHSRLHAVLPFLALARSGRPYALRIRWVKPEERVPASGARISKRSLVPPQPEPGYAEGALSNR
jgi:hypothetical protein